MTKFEKEVDYTKSISWQSFPNDKKEEVISILEKSFLENPHFKDYHMKSDAPGEFLSIEKQIEAAEEPALKIIAEHIGVSKSLNYSSSVYRNVIFHNPDEKKVKKALEIFNAAEQTVNQKYSQKELTP